jgi:hypothetical protein
VFNVEPFLYLEPKRVLPITKKGDPKNPFGTLFSNSVPCLISIGDANDINNMNRDHTKQCFYLRLLKLGKKTNPSCINYNNLRTRESRNNIFHC